MPERSGQSALKLAIKLGVSLLLLVWLAWYLDLRAVLHRLEKVQIYWVLAAWLCLFTGQVLSAIRWAWLAQGLGMNVRILRKLQLYFLGMFLSLFLPSIIGGDVARGYLLAKGRKGQGWQAAASVLLERINGVYGLSIIVTVCMLILSLPGSWWAIWLTAVGVLWLALFSYGFWSTYLPHALSAWKALPLTTPGFLITWWRSLPVSIVFQILVVQAHVFLGLGVGLELSWAAYGFIVCLVALASAIPVSFNGFGIREGGYVGLAAYFGGSSEAAAAMAALWVVVLALAALPGGVVLWRLGGAKALRQN